MSRPLLRTSMIRPETMLSAAISTRIARITNITSSSMSSARRNEADPSRQVQAIARGPAASSSAGTMASTASGSSTMTSISSTAPSRLKKGCASASGM